MDAATPRVCPHWVTHTLWASTKLCLQLFLTHIPTLSRHTHTYWGNSWLDPAPLWLPPPPPNSCEQKGSMWGTKGEGGDRERRERKRGGVVGASGRDRWVRGMDRIMMREKERMRRGMGKRGAELEAWTSHMWKIKEFKTINSKSSIYLLKQQNPPGFPADHCYIASLNHYGYKKYIKYKKITICSSSKEVRVLCFMYEAGKMLQRIWAYV